MGMKRTHPCRKREPEILADLLAGVEAARREGGDEAVHKYLDRVERLNKSLPPKVTETMAEIRGGRGTQR
jgi:hypothetical protein